MKTIITILSVVLAGAMLANGQNTVSFDNQSGEAALVKLIGPTSKEIEVPNDTKQAVQATAGKYVIKVRYGVQGKYHYTKGQEFKVDETATTTSDITITLHKVVNGNYDSRPISEQEFGVAHSLVAMPDHILKANESKEINDAASDGDLEKVKALLQSFAFVIHFFPRRIEIRLCLVPRFGSLIETVLDFSGDSLKLPRFRAYLGGDAVDDIVVT